MSAPPRRALARLQRAVWAASLVGLGYLVWRFESLRVPEGVAPELGLEAGTLLVVDRRPTTLAEGDLVVLADSTGLRALARLEPRHARESVVARVILVWPF